MNKNKKTKRLILIATIIFTYSLSSQAHIQQDLNFEKEAVGFNDLILDNELNNQSIKKTLNIRAPGSVLNEKRPVFIKID